MTSSTNGGGSDVLGSMMAEEYDDRHDYHASDLDDAEIERRLIEGMENDDRLQSGAGRRGVDGDVDFVRMSGLTQPDAEDAPWPDAEAEPELPEDADPSAPISFFEEGVDDVDAANDPITAHDRPLPNGDEIVTVARDAITPERPEPSFLRDLKSIVSDFSSDGLAHEPEEAENGADVPDSIDGLPEEDVLDAEDDAAPEWTRQLTPADEPVESSWERPAFEDLDADMLEWIAQKLESDGDAGSAPQWDLSGEEYSLETAPQAGQDPRDALDDIADLAQAGSTEPPPLAPLPNEAAPPRPIPPWAGFRRPLEEEDAADDAAADDTAAFVNSEQAVAPYDDPDHGDAPTTDTDCDDATSDVSANPVCLDGDVEAEQTATASPLPPSSLRTRELTRAQALMHSLEPAPQSDHDAVAAWEAHAPDLKPEANSAPALEAPAFNHDLPEQSIVPPMAPVVESRFDAAPDENDFDGAFTPRRRTRPRRRRWLNALLRLFFTMIILAALGAGAATGWYWYQRQAESPETAFRRAESRLNAGEYTAASNAFLGFTESFPQSPLKADALFNAAYALQAVPAANPKSETENTYRRSLALFDRFVEQYPGHDKMPRAQTMAAVLHYRLGEYEAAITRLQSANGRTTDPLVYLPSLRTLARSYARLGELDEARSAFLRAASLDTNFTPDQDYLELAALYKTYAAQTESEAERGTYVAEAIEMWNYALRVPGLPAPKRRAIKNYIAAEEQLLNEGTAPMSTAQSASELH